MKLLKNIVSFLNEGCRMSDGPFRFNRCLKEYSNAVPLLYFLYLHFKTKQNLRFSYLFELYAG